MLYISEDFENDVCIISLKGDIETLQSNGLRDKVFKIVDEKGIVKFILNFEGVNYIDSSGLGVLISIYKKVRPAGGFVRLVKVNENIKKLLKMVKLINFFKIYDTLEEALI